jgi:hypothetical protein
MELHAPRAIPFRLLANVAVDVRDLRIDCAEPRSSTCPA